MRQLLCPTSQIYFHKFGIVTGGYPAIVFYFSPIYNNNMEDMEGNTMASLMYIIVCHN